MKNKQTLSVKLGILLTILAFLNSGCDVLETIVRAIGDRCADPHFTVSTTRDSNSGVCTASDCSLRNAILLSNICPGRNYIAMPPGTFLLTLTGAGEDRGRTGDLDITDDLTIEAGRHTTIDGNGIDRVFDIKSSASVLLIGLRIQHGVGNSLGADSIGGGGGIRNDGRLNIESSIISGNGSSESESVSGGGYRYNGPGGGILSTGELLEINSATNISDNFAGQGGGIAVIPTAADPHPVLHLTHSSTYRNTAAEGGGLYLAAIGSGYEHMLDHFTIDANTATNQGAGIWNAASLVLNQGEINDNELSSGYTMGGGIYNTGTLSAIQVVIQNNFARDGGAIYNQFYANFDQSAIVNNRVLSTTVPWEGAMENLGSLTLQNSTVSGNEGVGLSNPSGSLHIAFSTIADNPGYQIQSGAASSSSLANSIVAGGTSCSFYDPSTVTSYGFNIDNTGTCGLHQPSDRVVDPLLQALVMESGTYVHPLSPGSPAIDTADPATCVAVDQRGVSRPQGTGCDRGAYEFTASLPLMIATPEPTKEGIVVIPTPSNPPGTILLTLDKNANCRVGPGTAYEVLTSVVQGQTVELSGRNDENTWWFTVLPGNNKCWISMVAGQPNGDPLQLPVHPAPAPPVPTVEIGGCSQYGNASACTTNGCSWDKQTSTCH